jgi:hypothetical protein
MGQFEFLITTSLDSQESSVEPSAIIVSDGRSLKNLLKNYCQSSLKLKSKQKPNSQVNFKQNSIIQLPPSNRRFLIKRSRPPPTASQKPQHRVGHPPKSSPRHRLHRQPNSPQQWNHPRQLQLLTVPNVDPRKNKRESTSSCNVSQIETISPK